MKLGLDVLHSASVLPPANLQIRRVTEEWASSRPVCTLSFPLPLYLLPFMLCCVRASTILLRNLMAILDADGDRHDSEADRVWKVEQSTLNPHSNN